MLTRLRILKQRSDLTTGEISKLTGIKSETLRGIFNGRIAKIPTGLIKMLEIHNEMIYYKGAYEALLGEQK